VDSERFDAELRTDVQGHAVAVHPKSRSERRIDLHGKTTLQRAVVVWTREGAYLSHLSADLSKG
jgi:hypothetical protein